MHVHSVANVMDVRAIGNAEWHFPLFLAYGVTGSRNMNDGTADVTLELLGARVLNGADVFALELSNAWSTTSWAS
jgi:hypothetical protein